MIMLRNVLVIVLAIAGVTRAGTVHFLVTERPGEEVHHDSFVLPLSNDDDIAHARDLIARGPDEASAPIVFADIVAGADQINRDLLKPNTPAWSWHVSNFVSFGDFGIELTDGWPTFVEQDVQGWIDNTGGAGVGHIGFWNYTVTRELAPSIAVPLPAAFPIGIALLAGCKLSQLRRRSNRREWPPHGFFPLQEW